MRDTVFLTILELRRKNTQHVPTFMTMTTTMTMTMMTRPVSSLYTEGLTCPEGQSSWALLISLFGEVLASRRGIVWVVFLCRFVPWNEVGLFLLSSLRHVTSAELPLTSGHVDGFFCAFRNGIRWIPCLAPSNTTSDDSFVTAPSWPANSSTSPATSYGPTTHTLTTRKL